MSDCCNEFEFTSPQGTFYMDGGIRGKDGVTFYPHVSAAGILSWTNDGGKQNPDPVNIKGADGMSAYAAAQQAGFTGTEAQFNAYLSGIGTLTEDVDDLKSAVDWKAPAIFETASGAIASFPDGAGDMPIKQVLVSIEPVQAGSGDPSPENVRPISGWTESSVTVTGKNFCPHVLQSAASSKGYTATPQSDGTLTVTGTWTGTANGVIGGSQSARFLLKPGQYILNGNNSSAYSEYGIRLQLINDSEYAYGYDSGNGLAFTLATDTIVIVRIFVSNSIATGKTIPDGGVMLRPMIRLASDADPTFEPYHGNTYSIAFPTDPGTVYGGTLDVTSGVLTVDRAMVTVTDPSVLNAGTGIFYFRPSPRPKYGTGINCISDKSSSVNIASNEYIRFTDRVGEETASEYLAKRENSVSVVYPITPTSVTLTATEIETILGQNNIWADCGPVSVDYPADTKLFIQKVNKPTDDDMTADAQIASGKYFIIGNNLYLSTTTIPAGDTIIPGTNCTKTDLAAALNALNA